MFDLFFGAPLPWHVLVLHGIVVFGPVAAVLAVCYAWLPRYRRRLKWWLVTASILAGVFGVWAKQSGEQLDRRLTSGLDPSNPDQAALLKPIRDHTQIGNVAGIVSPLFMVVALLVVAYLVKAYSPSVLGASLERMLRINDKPVSPAFELVGKLVLTLAALAVLVFVAWAGHTGAYAAWHAVVG